CVAARVRARARARGRDLEGAGARGALGCVRGAARPRRPAAHPRRRGAARGRVRARLGGARRAAAARALAMARPRAGALRSAGALGSGAGSVLGVALETRRKLYELGLRTPERVPARVVSIGNLTVGGAGKTTLVLYLAARARERGERVAVVARRYRPGPDGRGD